MPVLTNKFIFSLVPQRTPALMRPLIKPTFTMLNKKLILPQIKSKCEFVCQDALSLFQFFQILNASFQIEAHLAKTNSGWFAGGDHPTSADFMMAFPLEWMGSLAPDALGPKTKEYVKRVHERYACLALVQDN